MRAFARYITVLNYVLLCEFDAGMRLVSESFREIDTLDDPLGTSRLFANISLGKLHNGRGDFLAAIQAYEAARALYREDCHRNYYRPLSWGLGLAYALAGRVSEGIAALETAEAAERKIGSTAFRNMLLLHLARARIEAGQIDEAARNVSEALQLTRDWGNKQSEAGAHHLLGEVARLRNEHDHDTIERHFLDALTLAEALEMRPLAARCHLRLAWLYESRGGSERVRHADAATALLAQMGNPRSLEAAGVH
jgi:tetratricopeptide (TPR) repeat protein